MPATLIKSSVIKPRQVTMNDDGTLSVDAAASHSAGAAVVIEIKAPTNGQALYTVPANVTLTGHLVAAGVLLGGNSLSVSAATGGTIFSIATTGTGSANLSDTADISVAGGGAGNALTINVTGSASQAGLILIGHVR